MTKTSFVKLVKIETILVKKKNDILKLVEIKNRKCLVIIKKKKDSLIISLCLRFIFQIFLSLFNVNNLQI